MFLFAGVNLFCVFCPWVPWNVLVSFWQSSPFLFSCFSSFVYFSLFLPATQRGLIKPPGCHLHRCPQRLLFLGWPCVMRPRKWINQEVQCPTSRQHNWMLWAVGLTEAKTQREQIKLESKGERACQRMSEVAYFPGLLWSQWDNRHENAFFLVKGKIV